MKDEEENRQQMMENLFGVNSEDEDEEEEVDSEHESNHHRPNYISVSFELISMGSLMLYSKFNQTCSGQCNCFEVLGFDQVILIID